MIYINVLGNSLEAGSIGDEYDIVFVLKSLLIIIRDHVSIGNEYTLDFKFRISGVRDYYTGFDINMNSINDLNLFPSKYSDKLVSRLESNYFMNDFKYILI
jgi:hypothetical protein